LSDDVKPLAFLNLDEQVEVEPPRFKALIEDPPEAEEEREEVVTLMTHRNRRLTSKAKRAGFLKRRLRRARRPV